MGAFVRETLRVASVCFAWGWARKVAPACVRELVIHLASPDRIISSPPEHIFRVTFPVGALGTLARNTPVIIENGGLLVFFNWLAA